MSNTKEYWIHEAILKEDSKLPLKTNYINVNNLININYTQSFYYDAPNTLKIKSSNVVTGNTLSSNINMILPNISSINADIGDNIFIKCIGDFDVTVSTSGGDTLTGVTNIDNGGLMIITVTGLTTWDSVAILSVQSQANKILNVYQVSSYEDDDAAESGGLSEGDWYYNTTLKTNTKL